MIVFDSQKMVRSAEKLARSLEGARKRAENLDPVMEKIAEDLLAVIDKSYALETSPSGAKWPRLKPSTIARRKGRGRGILDLTGRQRRSYRYAVRDGTIRLYNTSGYLNPHVSGDRKRKPPRPPRRNPLPFVSLGGGRYRLATGDRAAAWRERSHRRIKNYIVRGRR